MNEKRVRVVHVIPHLALGGATLAAVALAERLDPARFAVKLAAGPDGDPDGSLMAELGHHGIELIPIADLCRSPRPRRDLRAMWQLAELLGRERPHIVHTHGAKSKLLVALASAVAGPPVMVAHIWSWEWQPARNAAERLLYEVEARIVAERYDALIACSEAMRGQGTARRVGSPPQYEVVLPSIDLDRFRPGGRERARSEVRAELGLPPGAPLVGSVMRLAPQKAPEVLIEAASRVRSAMPEVHWLVIGDGPLMADITEMVAHMGVADRVLLAGARRDVDRLLRACDLFVLSSRWEPFGMAYVEASALGLPVVGTRVDGAPEAVREGETGLLVAADDAAALAEAVGTLVSNPEMAQRMGSAWGRRDCAGRGSSGTSASWRASRRPTSGCCARRDLRPIRGSRGRGGGRARAHPRPPRPRRAPGARRARPPRPPGARGTAPG